MVNSHFFIKVFLNIYFCFIDYAKAFDCVDHNKLWKILKDRGIPDHLTCLLRNLYAGQETTVRTGHGTTDWFQVGKEYFKAVYCYAANLSYMQSESESEVAQSCPTLCDPMDWSLPGYFVHGIFQARILEWVASRVHHEKRWARRSTTWNQDFWEKYL